jgi:hypothetical protein
MTGSAASAPQIPGDVSVFAVDDMEAARAWVAV